MLSRVSISFINAGGSYRVGVGFLPFLHQITDTVIGWEKPEMQSPKGDVDLTLCCPRVSIRLSIIATAAHLESNWE